MSDPAEDLIRLNLGSGSEFQNLEGWKNLDIRNGYSVEDLHVYVDDSVEEVYASHVLEHFPISKIKAVLTEWVRVLKPGGLLRVAVPNFIWIAQEVLRGNESPNEMIDPKCLYYLMGGQVDENDFHASSFTPTLLERFMVESGIEHDTIHVFEPEFDDCTKLPVSLNLAGKKPVNASVAKETTDQLAHELEGKAQDPSMVVPQVTDNPALGGIRIDAVMSMPRLCFSDTIFVALRAFVPLGIRLAKASGVFWGQCLTRLIESSIKEKAEFVITVDYDTLFTSMHVMRMIQLIISNPSVDCIVANQMKRENDCPMFTLPVPEGKTRPRTKANTDEFNVHLTLIRSAHFGLSIFRSSAFDNMPKPWFTSIPDKDGGWGDDIVDENGVVQQVGRIDEDVNFWLKWGECGNTLYLANYVSIGHTQMSCTWPGRPQDKWDPIHQYLSDFEKNGSPRYIVEGLKHVPPKGPVT